MGVANILRCMGMATAEWRQRADRGQRHIVYDLGTHVGAPWASQPCHRTGCQQRTAQGARNIQKSDHEEAVGASIKISETSTQPSIFQQCNRSSGTDFITMGMASNNPSLDWRGPHPQQFILCTIMSFLPGRRALAAAGLPYPRCRPLRPRRRPGVVRLDRRVRRRGKLGLRRAHRLH